MKEYVVISGKGGTGKTSLTAAFAMIAENPILCDADVDAADLHLLLEPKIKKKVEFNGGNRAVINREKCLECGYCRDLCRFNGISDDFIVNPINCEGCGVCVDLCPEQAIDFPLQKSGDWFVSETRAGTMVHARLGIADENSGKLVSLIRREARKISEEMGNELIITDGPPGIGCPVIAALSGAEAVIIVVEPTVSGIHDVKRVAALTQHFGITPMLCVNRCDLNAKVTEDIESFSKKEGFIVLPNIPFDADFVRAMVQGKTLSEFINSTTTKRIRKIWELIEHAAAVNFVKPAIQNVRFEKGVI